MNVNTILHLPGGEPIEDRPHVVALFRKLKVTNRAMAISRGLDLAAPEGGRANEACADLLAETGRYDESLSAYDRAISLTTESGLRAFLNLRRQQLERAVRTRC